MAVPYIGSIDAIYGTAYGVMVVTKVLLLLCLLLLGGMNYLLVDRMRRVPGTPILRLKRFAEVEIGLGITVLFAAASLTSQPPAVDLPTDRASLHEIAERFEAGVAALREPGPCQPRHPGAASTARRRGSHQRPTRRWPQAFVPGEGVSPPRNAEGHRLVGI